ncbi:mannan endo-1,4-beta-mannosidase [Powellomyces hirtus]|uniref:Mannan endo-1,4-beta-mannosidase n=1 Tax=Powellomyces hirtus TaxID=109895 RepID=A0A507E5E6_9FUNG|nr:mannan endo-1,4-beta-mannosidase [Powellomyces hirtus]
MGHVSRRACCSIVFYTKALFAVSLAVGFMAFMSYRVYDMHKNPPAKPPATDLNIPVGNGPNRIPGSSGCTAGDARLGRLEPPAGVLMGYSLEWTTDGNLPSDIQKKLGRKPSVYNAFMRMTNDPVQPFDPSSEMLSWHGEQVREVGGILALTLEPIGALGGLTDAGIAVVVKKLRELNDLGVPIILRFGHEMNGEWTMYGYRPTYYIDMFRRMADAVHQGTTTTAMLWSPNVAIAYPFNTAPGDTAQSPWTTAGADDLRLLDTNNNGKVDPADDPYMPYWPGPDYVDWVGLSLYYYQDGGPNEVPTPGYFVDYLRGTNLAAYNVDPATNAAVRDFYKRFGEDMGKPVAISESGPGFHLNVAGPDELAVKQAWWEETLNLETLASLPLLKMIVNFEEQKPENPPVSPVSDWSYTNNPAVLAGYTAHLNTMGNELLWGDSLSLTCTGAIGVKAVAGAPAPLPPVPARTAPTAPVPANPVVPPPAPGTVQPPPAYIPEVPTPPVPAPVPTSVAPIPAAPVPTSVIPAPVVVNPVPTPTLPVAEPAPTPPVPTAPVTPPTVPVADTVEPEAPAGPAVTEGVGAPVVGGPPA